MELMMSNCQKRASTWSLANWNFIKTRLIASIKFGKRVEQRRKEERSEVK
jgi:hypothetical protein